MKLYNFLLLLLLLTGCGPEERSSVNPVKTEKVVDTTPKMLQFSLSKADLLKSQGQYQQALVEYRKTMETDKSDHNRKKAKLGAARCLLRMGRYHSAIANLKPLPFVVESDLDREVMAVAGEIMLRTKEYEEAETFLEFALDNLEGTEDKLLQLLLFDTERKSSEAPSWQAESCANLGYAYLMNDKPKKAAILYRHAAELFADKGDSVSHSKVLGMSDGIEKIINYYKSSQ